MPDLSHSLVYYERSGWKHVAKATYSFGFICKHQTYKSIINIWHDRQPSNIYIKKESCNHPLLFILAWADEVLSKLARPQRLGLGISPP